MLAHNRPGSVRRFDEEENKWYRADKTGGHQSFENDVMRIKSRVPFFYAITHEGRSEKLIPSAINRN